ncbi:NUC173-domain-containing protein [Violaceomyces palustris]|uniref:NUC173-domain-containing protein n=1 Tax=Violaceomyces palustris TaxID=1673888 RepID=A0ACD0NSY7_9BASI|nr:NUC173-domain-containing protein [Violaceomyces palustris]
MATVTQPVNSNGDGLQVALSKIRHHTNSKLENQKAPAQLLVAIEATLKEQDQLQASSNPAPYAKPEQGAGSSRHAVSERKPAEYFLALEGMLDKGQSKGAPASLLPCTLYLLSIVVPYVSAGILRARLSSLLPPISFLLSNPFVSTSVGEAGATAAENHAAALRSALGILQSSFTAFSVEPTSLEKDLPLRGCWNAVLKLCADSRPKVRRRAQEVISAVLLSSETPGPSHPYAKPTFDWAVSVLTSVADSGAVVSSRKSEHTPQYDKKSGKAKQADAAAALRQQRVAEGDGASVGIWVCSFVKQLSPSMPPASTDSLCAILLRLPGLQNPFLTVAAFDVFEALFKVSRPVLATSGATSSLVPSSVRESDQLDERRMKNDTLSRTLKSLLSPGIAPSSADVQLLPSYLRALEHAVVAYSRQEEGQAIWKLAPKVWSEIADLSLSARSESSRTSPAVRAAGKDAMVALLRYCIPDSAIEETLDDKENDSPLSKMIALLSDALGRHSLRYSHARAEILTILAAAVTRLRYRKSSEDRSTRGPPAATMLLLPLVKTVADLRSQQGFEHREHADLVIGAAVEVCGPQALLEALPLNLLGEAGGMGRAWLLPLMRTRITNTELGHFTRSMVPLSETLFNRRAQAEEGGLDGKPRPVEAKMYEALTEQVWACFPGYCDLPTDLVNTFTRHFAELLANVLYTQPTLRPSIFRGLQALVERNEALVASGASPENLYQSFGVDQDVGKINISHLAGMAPNLLAVFFNVFSQSPGESRGYVYECICSYLRIMTPADLAETYGKVKSTLEKALPQLAQTRNRDAGPGSVPAVPNTMLDLLIALVPFLDLSSSGAAIDLFDLVCEDKLLRCNDSGVQKKTYRILSRLLEGSRGTRVLRIENGSVGRVGELLSRLGEATPDVLPGAKRDRILLLANLVPKIPSNQLHFLPSIIPEAVLATKEANQATRENAYDLLVQMGHKMKAGGTLKRHLVEGAADEGVLQEDEMQDSETPADVTEYMTMVAAGLAGASPHMMSASITALSRLVYEFKDELARGTLDEMLETISIYLGSNNREIVKSALGFVKVAIVSFNGNLIDSHLPKMIPALLNWSAEHKQHFKSKVRHIFERLIRRFGFERISILTDEDNRKLINNIRKRKERARRQKAVREDEADRDDDEVDVNSAPAKRSAGADAFEEAIYGSESEISDSDDDQAQGVSTLTQQASRGRATGKGDKAKQATKVKSRRKHEDEAYILEDNDEPMDLLDRTAIAGRITASNPSAKMDRRRKPGQEAAKFELDEATGRMVIKDPEAKAADSVQGNEATDIAGAGRAYLDQERGIDGFTHSGRGGAVKFNKNNKRNREQELELELEQMAAEGHSEAANASKATKKTRKEKEKIGAEFRAKRAQGDVSKNGQSPYAYVPLSQVAGKKGKDFSKNITGKGKDRKRH